MNEKIYTIINEEYQKKALAESINNPTFTYIDFLEQLSNDTEEIYQEIWKKIINKFFNDDKNSNIISIRIIESYSFNTKDYNSFTHTETKEKYSELIKHVELYEKLHKYETIKYIKRANNAKPFLLLNKTELNKKLEEDGFFKYTQYGNEYIITSKKISEHLSKAISYAKTLKKQ